MATKTTKRHHTNAVVQIQEGNWTSGEHSETRCMLCILKPLTISMKICCLLHSFELKDKDNRQKKAKWSLAKVSSLVMMIVQILNVLRLPANLAIGESADLPMKLTFAIWTIQCTLNRIVLFFTFSGNHLCSVLSIWNENFLSTPEELPECPKKFTKSAKKLVVFSVVTGWICLAVNAGFLLFMAMCPIKGARHIVSLVAAPLPESATASILGSFVCILIQFSWIFPVVYVVVLCYIVSQQFDLLKKVLQQNISKSEGSLPPKFEYCRRQHVSLCKIVDELDCQLKYLYLVSFMTNIPLSCFLCYRLAKIKLDTFDIFISCFWISCNVLNVVIPGLAAAIVHEKVSIISGRSM